MSKNFSLFIREEVYILFSFHREKRFVARAREKKESEEKARRRADASEFNPLVFLSRVFFFFFVFVFLFENDERRWNEVDED